MINRGCDVRHQHTEQVEDDSCRGPSVVHGKAPIQEDGPHDNAHQDASCMRPGVPEFLFMTEMYFEFHILSFKISAKIRNVFGILSPFPILFVLLE